MTLNALFAALALALLLSGCAQSASTMGTVGDAPALPKSGSPSTTVASLPPLQLIVNSYPPTREATQILMGTVNHAAKVSVGPVSTNATKEWTLVVPVEYGHTNLTVVADDGRSTVAVKLLAVRLAQAEFKVAFTMAVPQHVAYDDKVWYDPQGYASAPMYTANKTEHPPIASVHDVMVSWTQQWGHPITYSGPSSFGFGVEAIDGIGAPLSNGTPPYWCYKLNGDGTNVLGITSQAVKPGDVIAWDFSTCV